MAVVPGSLDLESQPPMMVPLRHFVAGLGFLFLGALLGLGGLLTTSPAMLPIAHVHLLLVGWVCLTIMGAMTQFVPVWSGVELYNHHFASYQLTLVSLGLAGFVLSLLGGWRITLPAFGLVMLSGFWLFVYNIARTLSQVDRWDVTELHFGAGLGFFVLVTLLGVSVATDAAVQHAALLPIARSRVIATHATLAVYGAVLTTIIGALYQLATMFTQTEFHDYEVYLKRVETVGYPLGVVGLAAGRLLGIPLLGRVGGLLVVGGIAITSVLLARRLIETQVPRTPMLSRYAVVAASFALWSAGTLPVWAVSPLKVTARFGAPGASHLLAIGCIGFVVLGTLYHIIPFIVWVHRYSDRLGYEDVPMIDDLYNERLAALDFWLILLGSVVLTVTDMLDLSEIVTLTGGLVLLLGTAIFTWNMLNVIRTHSPHSVRDLVAPELGARRR